MSRLMKRKFGDESVALQQRISTLPTAKVEELTEELIGASALADVETWLNRQA